jgi:hypothetical protein
MKVSKLILYAIGLMILVAVAGTFSSHKLSATVRAALTEIVIPSKPYYSNFRSNYGYYSSAPASGTLGVTNLTFSNIQMGEPEELDVFIPVFSAGGCNGGTIDQTSSTPILKVMVGTNQTLSMAFPSPIVFPAGTDGLSCVGVATPSAKIEVSITGFVN